MIFKKKEPEDLPPHELGPPVNFKATAATDQQNQINLIEARQSYGIVTAKEIFADALSKRADRLMLDYTRESVAVRFDVDGVWHPLNPLDRESGDLMLAVLKKICNLNPGERRARQAAPFGVSYRDRKYTCSLTSQGTQTGERTVIRIDETGNKIGSILDAGMREKMLDQWKHMVGRQLDYESEDTSLKTGLVIISAPPAGGLTTTWNLALGITDRYMRDFISIEDEAKLETEVENIEVATYKGAEGESPDKLLPKLLLKQQEVFVVPEIPNSETLRMLCDEILNEDRMVFISVRAKDAAEALLRTLMLKPPVEQFAKAVTCVLNVRLIRRLCEYCKQAYQPHPQLLQKLGLPPTRVSQLFKEWEPPPPDPEQEAKRKKKGEEEEPQICRACSGIGYRGRVGIFEMIVVDDAIREALVKQPRLEVIRHLARQAGNRSLQEEGILLVAKGVTSVAELQRIMKQ